MQVPKGYPRSVHENYFVLAVAMRRQTLTPELKMTFQNGLQAISDATPIFLMKDRIRALTQPLEQAA